MASNLNLCEISTCSSPLSLHGSSASKDLTYQNRFQLWKQGFDAAISQSSESAITDGVDTGPTGADTFTTKNSRNSHRKSEGKSTSFSSSSSVFANCKTTPTAANPRSSAQSSNYHANSPRDRQVQPFVGSSETSLESDIDADATATQNSKESELTVALPGQGSDAHRTTLERMMAEFDGVGSMGTIFPNPTSVWDGNEGGLQRLMAKIGARICRQFRPVEAVQKTFENYVDIQISAAVSANNLRRKKRKTIENILTATYGNIENKFSYDWICRNWTGADSREGESNETTCSITLIKSFGKEWEDYYKMRSRERMGLYYKVAQQIKSYEDKLMSSLDEVVCCEDTKILDTYHDEAYPIIHSLYQDSEVCIRKLIPKIEHIMNTIRESVARINVERLDNEVKLAQRAIRYALTKYCEMMSKKLVYAVPQAELKNLHDSISCKIITSFYGIQGFKYTRTWGLKETLLVETLKRECLEFVRVNNTNTRLENIEIESMIQNYVTNFRRSVIQLLSEDGDKAQLATLLNNMLSDATKAIKLRYPIKVEEIMNRLRPRVLDTMNNMALNDISVSIVTRGVTGAPQSVCVNPNAKQSPIGPDSERPLNPTTSSPAFPQPEPSVARPVVPQPASEVAHDNPETSHVLRPRSSLNIPADRPTVGLTDRMPSKPEKDVSSDYLSPQTPAPETKLRRRRSSSVAAAQPEVHNAPPASKPLHSRQYDTARVFLGSPVRVNRKRSNRKSVSGTSGTLVDSDLVIPVPESSAAPPTPTGIQEPVAEKENSSGCNQTFVEPETVPVSVGKTNLVSEPTEEQLKPAAVGKEPPPTPEDTTIVPKRQLRSSTLPAPRQTQLPEPVPESPPTRQNTRSERAPSTPRRCSQRIIKKETSESPVASTATTAKATVTPVPATKSPLLATKQPKASPISSTPLKNRRSSTLKLSSSYGVGIFFSETKAYVAVTVRKAVQNFTLSTKLRLTQSAARAPELLLDSEPSRPGIFAVSLDVYLFLTEPEYVITEETFASPESEPKPLWAEEVLAIFIHKVMEEIQTRWNKDITRDVITIGLPTFVSSRCKQRLKTALSLAGLHKSVFVQATTGIGVSYLRSPVTLDEHYCLVAYIEDIVQNVALLKVQDGKVTVVATAGSVCYKKDTAVSILNNLSLAINSVTSAAGIKSQAIKHCLCVIEVDEQSLDNLTRPEEAIPKTSWAAEQWQKDLPRGCKLERVDVVEGLVGGLAAISESRTSSSALKDCYSEVFPYTLEIRRVSNVTNGTLKLVAKNGESKNVTVNIAAKNLGTEELRSIIYCRHYDHKTKEIELFASENLRKKDPNAMVKVMINSEGIIATGIETRNPTILGSDWKREVRPTGMPLTELDEVKRRFKAFVTNSRGDGKICSPPLKKVKWSEA